MVDLQAGDPETRAHWQRFVDESKIYFYSVFNKLDMEIHDADIVGESGYNDMLDETCRLLEESGVAVRSEGALCVFFDDVKGPDGNPIPLIVQKTQRRLRLRGHRPLRDPRPGAATSRRTP